MSLYNQLFGENEDAMALLGMLSLTRNDFQRYRDVYLNKEGNKIIVLTRLGGNNAKYYRQVYMNMRRHKYYIKDYDDEFDNTYAYFEFKVPKEYENTCKSIAPSEDRLTVSAMFEKEIKEAENPNSEAAKKIEKIADEIIKNIKNNNPFIGL